MIKILFICHGNICRSPMAEFIMRELLRQQGLEASYEVSSAATSAEELGNPVYPAARRKLLQHSIDASGKTARQMTQADYAYYDYLLGMDMTNIRQMQRISGGDPDGKISRLLEGAPTPRDTADPCCTDDFEQAWQDILESCQLILARLTHDSHS